MDDDSDMSCFDHIRSNSSSIETPKQEQEESDSKRRRCASKIEYIKSQL